MERLSGVAEARGFLLACDRSLRLYRVSGSFYVNFSGCLGARCGVSSKEYLDPGSKFGVLYRLGATLGATIHRKVLIAGPFSLLSSSRGVRPIRIIERCLAVSRMGRLVETEYKGRAMGHTFLFSYGYKLHLDSIETLG